MLITFPLAAIAVAGLALLHPLHRRLQLTRAKHPSPQGHPRIASLLARAIPFYGYDAAHFFRSDGAPEEAVEQRRRGFERLAGTLNGRSPDTVAATRRLEKGLSDLQFTKAYAVPFQYRQYVNERLGVGSLLAAASGVSVTDLDGREAYDVAGSYGLNVFGYDFYKDCIDAGIGRVRALGPVLGAYHPIVQDNVDRLRAISGLDEVSFHMSGTEAVMQAVRLARFHTRRPRLVRFAGAYHGWWDDVQPGIGNPHQPRDTFTLRDMDARTLTVLRTRRDIACVLVNPLQALHPNHSAPGDGTLVSSDREAQANRAEYAAWLRELRAVCTARGIVLIFDEVFVGFRLAPGGAQEYFGVKADMVTYGKTVGGGLPVGVLCGTAEVMKRFRAGQPSDICFARGTFNAHPYVMAAMNEFLRRIDSPEIQTMYDAADATWNARAAHLNARLAGEGLPVRVANLGSIWTVLYTAPSRYNWMLQFYLRAEGLRLSWVGTGRLIFSHTYTEDDFAAVEDRFVRAALAMMTDGWWQQRSSMTNRAIRRLVAKEIVAVRVARGFGRRAHAARSRTIGSFHSPRQT